ncbi:AlpA family transcriptional regulator [Cypionkella sp.]|uniref:helix-turn-helix transcriptional regulator n=1 Tax=Cypionkella sp. TaxID=2811411 RepID=UPI002716729B|nr:hypothetical protein [Cypionkella sp.]MDO8984266.1 hypothetical protein [Cypionkella sp.]
MASANLNINVTEKRMMSEAEAASYCGFVAAKHFKVCCNVQPVNLGGKVLRYDKRDLDQWIDTEKTGDADNSREAILSRL